MDSEWGVVGAVLAFYGVIFLGILSVVIGVHAVICYLLTLPLKRLPEQYRLMAPGQVWLLLIPCFNLVWNFFVYQRIADSLKAYFDSVGDPTVGDCGKGVGLWYAISVCCCLVPCLNYIAWLPALILLIIYLVKIHELKQRLPLAAV